MIKVKSNLKVFSICAICALLIVLIGCVKPTVGPAEEKAPIYIGLNVDLTGPASGLGIAYNAGAQDRIRLVNEKGGIDGHKVVGKAWDTKNEMVLGLSGIERFLTVDKVSGIVTLGSHIGTAAMPKVREAKTPLIMPTEPIVQLSRPDNEYTFLAYSTYADQFPAALTWWIDQHWKESRKPRLAIQAVDYIVGWTSVNRILGLAKRTGAFEVSYLAFHPMNCLDFSTYVAGALATNPDIILIGTIDAPQIAYSKAFEKTGSKVPHLFFSACAPSYTMQAMSPIVWNNRNWYGFENYSLWRETNVRGIKELHDLRKKWYGNDDDPGAPSYTMGYAVVAVLLEGISRAVDKVGFDNLDGAAIKNVLESGEMAKFDLGGIIPGVAYSATERRMYTKIKMSIAIGPPGW
jgi:ABC-type branched-subunit amino acid transport system substrate-binding protein